MAGENGEGTLPSELSFVLLSELGAEIVWCVSLEPKNGN